MGFNINKAQKALILFEGNGEAALKFLEDDDFII